MKKEIEKLEKEFEERFGYMKNTDFIDMTGQFEGFKFFLNQKLKQQEKEILRELINNFEGIKAMDRKMLTIDEIIEIVTKVGK